MKAWKTDCGEWAEIVYADKRSEARLRGAGRLDCEYLEVTAVRAPQFDGMEPDGPTHKQLFEEHGWYFECQTCTGLAIHDCGGQFIGGEAICATCLERALQNAPKPEVAAEGAP